jgi:signal transduction histidine kinase
MAIPLNVIIYFALEYSSTNVIRWLPIIFGITVIALSVFANKLKPSVTSSILIADMFFAGMFNLLLGLIDLASLWFVLSIIFVLISKNKKSALIIFVFALMLIIITGVLMMNRNSHFPIKYGFENCQFACVSVRLLHFLLIGYLVYRVLSKFIETIYKNVSEIEEKLVELRKLNDIVVLERDEKIAIKQKMTEAVISTEENERKRIAADLHDGLGPLLSTIRLHFQAFLDAPPYEQIAIKKRLEEIIATATNEVYRISHNISPYIIENHGLDFAVINFIKDIQMSGMKVEWVIENVSDVRDNIALSVYRIIVELINNTIKHADASIITIDLQATNSTLTLLYSDNGKGFHIEKAKSKGIGLTSIANRINTINGILEYQSLPFKGVKVSITIPLSDEKN